MSDARAGERSITPHDPVPARMKVGILSSGSDEFANLMSLYDAFGRDPLFEVVAIPYGIKHPSTGYVNDAEDYRRYLDGHGVGTRELSSLEQMDVLFTFLPYLGLLDESLQRRLRETRLCYVPYASLVNVVAYDNPFYDMCWKIFLDHDLVRERFSEARGDAWVAERCIVSGLPKLDAYRSDRLTTEDYWPRARDPRIKRAMILDHWSIEWSDPDEGSVRRQGYSRFSRLKDTFLELPVMYPDVDFVFRPHPLLFDNLVATGTLARDEIESFVSAFERHPNAVVDDLSEDYMAPFKESDCLIATGISCLLEYLPSGRPILFLDKPDGDGLNEYGDLLVRYHYRGRRAEHVHRFLREVVLQGRDVMEDLRLENMREHLLMPAGGAGVAIVSHIKDLLESSESRHQRR